MPKYVVEYRYWDSMDDDTYVATETVDASSAHEAIGYAWWEIRDNVESYGGTIDDLDAWIVEDTDNMVVVHVAKAIYVSTTGSPFDSWATLQTQKKQQYIRAARAAIGELNE